MTNDGTRQGWTSSPNNRGTLDILWGCGVTIILCCWSMLCLNVPAAADTEWTVFRRRTCVFILTILGPEMVGITAAGQYLAAHQSAKDFAAAGFSDWSIQHAFFAEMGGFVLKTRDWKPFPVSAKQLLWLLQHGYVHHISPAVSDHINDKNKVNWIMRLIMVVQVVWFLINFFARLVKGLSVTALELTTVAFVYCSVPIIFIWRHKPADVGCPEILITESTIAEIVRAGGDAAREPYYNTPLDFIDREEWPLSVYWSHLRNLLRCLHINAGSQERPVSRISNFDCKKVPHTIFFLGAIYFFGFAGIFIGGWNLSLPTHTEQTLWRTASLLCLGCLAGGELVTFVGFEIWPRIMSRKRTQDDQATTDNECESQHSRGERLAPSKARPRTIWDWFRNNSVRKDPHVGVPLKVILSIYILSIAYIMGRVIIVVVDFLELRSLPASCYKTLDWEHIIPHVG